MSTLYLPNKQKYIIAYQVIQDWEGKGGSWNHGWYKSVIFKNKADAQEFLNNVEKQWKEGFWPSDLGKNYSTSKPYIKEVGIMLEYVEPGNGDDYTARTYSSHVCRED